MVGLVVPMMCAQVNFESELSALFTWSGSSLQAALTSHTLYGHVLLYLVFTMVFVYARLYHDGITSYNGKWPDSVISAFQFITGMQLLEAYLRLTPLPCAHTFVACICEGVSLYESVSLYHARFECLNFISMSNCKDARCT